MARWIAAAGVAAVFGATGMAGSPAEFIPQGKERTQIERDLYLPDPPVTERRPARPMPEPFEAVWAAAVRLTCGPLGTVPLVPREKW